ncbi:hypothetical protein [Yoonia sp. R78084]|uniref:hypothetical protein n=1 Tax=Yoonia sp. R78084 TaxID=3093869 RepID=UPI0037DC2773
MAETMRQLVDEVRAALQDKLRVRGRTLEKQLRRAGRQLPRHVRNDATYLAQAVALSDNPKLARMIDMAKAKKAHRNILAHLETVDIGAQRRNAALNMLASVMFALLVTGVLLLGVMWLRGFI